MPTPFKTHVAKDATVIAALNAVMNAGYTFYSWQGHAPLPLFDDLRVAVDLAGTPAVIALLSTLLGTAATRAKLADGRVDVSGVHAPLLFRLLPRGIVLRALVLAALATGLLVMPLWLTLVASGVTAVSVATAVGLKVAITVVMTLLIVPLVITACLADVQPGTTPNFAL